MRIAKTVCITLPPDLLKKAQRTAAREHRTMSELVREALRQYMANAVGEKPAAKVRGEDPAASPQDQGGTSHVLHSFRMEKPSK